MTIVLSAPVYQRPTPPPPGWNRKNPTNTTVFSTSAPQRENYNIPEYFPHLELNRDQCYFSAKKIDYENENLDFLAGQYALTEELCMDKKNSGLILEDASYNGIRKVARLAKEDARAGTDTTENNELLNYQVDVISACALFVTNPERASQELINTGAPISFTLNYDDERRFCNNVSYDFLEPDDLGTERPRPLFQVCNAAFQAAKDVSSLPQWWSGRDGSMREWRPPEKDFQIGALTLAKDICQSLYPDGLSEKPWALVNQLDLAMENLSAEESAETHSRVQSRQATFD